MINIRRLGADEDLSPLIPLSREFFEEYEGHHEELFRIHDLQESHITAHFLGTLRSGNAATYLASLDEKIVGYVTVKTISQAEFYAIDRVGTIMGLMVTRSCRRRGVATRLLAAARSFFEEKQVRYFTLYTAAANAGALEFYRKNGLRPLHVTMVGDLI